MLPLDYPSTLSRLNDYVNRRGVHYSLDTVRSVATALGNVHQDLPPTIHVAGTNGKGSVCRAIATGLTRAGYRTALYTSPHIHEYTERFQLDLCPISPSLFVDLFQQVTAVSCPTLTEFEYLTLMFFCLCQSHRPDYVILETGLGGRLDATNLVNAHWVVITAISLDHQAILGPTLTDIAHEKAGIITSNAPVFITDQDPETMAVIQERAHQHHAPVFISPHTSSPDPYLPDYLFTNLGLSNMVLDTIHPNMSIQARLNDRDWGRWTVYRRSSQVVIVDAAHNEAAIRAVTQCMSRQFSTWSCFVGIQQTKEASGMLAQIMSVASRVVYAIFDPDRAYRPEDPRLTYSLDIPNDPVVLITGSFYFIAAYQAMLDADE